MPRWIKIVFWTGIPVIKFRYIYYFYKGKLCCSQSILRCIIYVIKLSIFNLKKFSALKVILIDILIVWGWLIIGSWKRISFSYWRLLKILLFPYFYLYEIFIVSSAKFNVQIRLLYRRRIAVLLIKDILLLIKSLSFWLIVFLIYCFSIFHLWIWKCCFWL